MGKNIAGKSDSLGINPMKNTRTFVYKLVNTSLFKKLCSHVL